MANGPHPQRCDLGDAPLAEAAAPTRDIGTTDLFWGTWGQGLLTDWWETTADLIWPQSVITFGRMRHDPQLRGVLSAYLLPILRATWAVDPEGCRPEAATRVAEDLGLPLLGSEVQRGPARRGGVNWRKHLHQAAYNHLVYGHMPFELRYRIEEAAPGGVRLDHLGARMPWTIAQIHMNRDATISEIVQTTQDEPIPANRLLWYVHDQEGANWAGISMLRPVFGMWLLKHETMRVHASSIRRFGMGVPEVTAPPGATAGQVAEAQALAAGFRAGDQSGAGMPAGFTFNLKGMTGSVPDALEFLRYLDQAMAKMALAGLIELGQTETGSRALGETFLDLFLLSLQAVADDLADTITSGQEGMPGVSTDLVAQNWGEDEPAPRIVCTDVGENYEVTAEALAKLTEFGALSPDPELDSWIRKTWRLPKRDTAWEPTSRGIPAPGAPAGPVENPPGGDVPPGLPAPAAPAPPGGQGAPAARRGSPPRAAAFPGGTGLRRQLTPAEAASGFDPAGHQRAWLDALGGLVASYRPVAAAQRAQLVEQVSAAVERGTLARLGRLAIPAAGLAEGGGVILAAMTSVAQRAAEALAAEAASQGVKLAVPAMPAGRLGKIAEARAGVLGGWYAGQAGQHALQVVHAALSPAAQTAGAAVDVFLNGLSDRSLYEQLGAALTAAQNAGRGAVLDANPLAAGRATYVASEIIDQNTCGPCEDVDQMQFSSLAEAESSYPAGGYMYCEGGLRCRGTFIALWGGE
jgi:hypothetical protein